MPMAVRLVPPVQGANAIIKRDNDNNELKSLKYAESGQYGDAKFFVKLFGNKFIYDQSLCQWFVYTGHHWEADVFNLAFSKLDEIRNIYELSAKQELAVFSNGDKKSNKAPVLFNKVKALQGRRYREDVLKFASAGDALSISGEEWDHNPLLLACPNGVIDLETSGFRDGNHKDYIRTACPTLWKRNATCPNWIRFLREILNGDDALYEYLHHLLGYAITGLTTEHILAILWGDEGRNGKGTLLETLSYVLGKLAQPTKSELLLNQDRTRASNSHDADIMALRGKRIIWASEINEGRRLDASQVKRLTGGDTLVGRAPHAKQEIVFSPAHTLFLLTNHKPRINSSNLAIWKRIHLLPFELSFVDTPTKPFHRKRDKNLLKKLKSESSGILYWLVQGCLKWQLQGLNPPTKVLAGVEEYKQEENTFELFINDTDICRLKESGIVRGSEIYKAYCQWCSQGRYENKIDKNTFGMTMKKYFTCVHSTYVYYKGIELV